MKKLEQLIPDIEQLLIQGIKIPKEKSEEFGNAMSTLISSRLDPKERERRGTLRMSNIGKPDRQLWYEINTPQDAIPLPPEAFLKFLIGDILEEVILLLAELSGHKVEGKQDTMMLYDIEGHRDAVIDGVTVDVKTASPYSFNNFKSGLKPETDKFGYILQLNNYIESGKEDPLVREKDKGAFLAFQKVTGNLHLDVHNKTEVPLKAIFDHKKEVVQRDEPPEKCYEPEPMGKSGNTKLPIGCSYCAFVDKCWPEKRTFIYSTGPVHLIEVSKEPNVPELKNE